MFLVEKKHMQIKYSWRQQTNKVIVIQTQTPLSNFTSYWDNVITFNEVTDPEGTNLLFWWFCDKNYVLSGRSDSLSLGPYPRNQTPQKEHGTWQEVTSYLSSAPPETQNLAVGILLEGFLVVAVFILL